MKRLTGRRRLDGRRFCSIGSGGSGEDDRLEEAAEIPSNLIEDSELSEDELGGWAKAQLTDDSLELTSRMSDPSSSSPSSLDTSRTGTKTDVYPSRHESNVIT